MGKIRWLFTSLVLIGATAAAPPPPPPAALPTLDASTAQAIVAGCAAHARGKGQSQAIVVVDLGGHIVAALRMDGNGTGIFDFAFAKARAVAAWGFATARMAQAAIETAGFGDAPEVVTVPGGVPVWSGDGKVRLGGVGVSGEAPADDVACAEAGIRAAGLRATRG